MTTLAELYQSLLDERNYWNAPAPDDYPEFAARLFTADAMARRKTAAGRITEEIQDCIDLMRKTGAIT